MVSEWWAFNQGKESIFTNIIFLLLTFPQTKNDFEKQQKEPKENVTPVSNKAQVSIPY